MSVYCHCDFRPDKEPSVQVHLLQPHEPGGEEHHPHAEDGQRVPDLRSPRPHEDPGGHQLRFRQVDFSPRDTLSSIVKVENLTIYYDETAKPVIIAKLTLMG